LGYPKGGITPKREAIGFFAEQKNGRVAQRPDSFTNLRPASDSASLSSRRPLIQQIGTAKVFSAVPIQKTETKTELDSE